MLQLLYHVRVNLKLKKRRFLAETIDCLSHDIRLSRLEVKQHTTEAVLKVNNPTTQTKVSSFLGPCDAFRRFVQSLARLADRLSENVRKNQPE